jgi:porphobilinogen synthase
VFATLFCFTAAPYLDIVRDVRAVASTTPVAIYHVSGEYAMLWHAAAAGAFGLVEGVNESLMGAKRAGASIILTYFTPLLLKHIREQQDKERAAALAESKGTPQA